MSTMSNRIDVKILGVHEEDDNIEQQMLCQFVVALHSSELKVMKKTYLQ